MSPVTSDKYRRSMRHVAASVCVIAAKTNGQRFGMTATSVCSVSMTPPLLLVCINSEATSHDSLAGASIFSVSVLSDSQRHVADIYAGLSGIARDRRFEALEDDWCTGPQDVPMLRNAVTSLACRIVNMIPTGTHTIFIGEVLEARCAEDLSPLLYARGKYHALGATPVDARQSPACCE